MNPRNASSHEPIDASGIDIESGVSATSGFGFVHLRWGTMSGQLTTREAREHAMGIIEAADAAEHDAVIMAWLTSTMGLEVAASAAVLADLRTARAMMRARDLDS